MTPDPESAAPATSSNTVAFSATVRAAMDDAILEARSGQPGHSPADVPQPITSGLPPGVRIRRGVSSDVPAILNLINGLAEYERAPLETVVDEATLLRDGFGTEPLFYVYLVERRQGSEEASSMWQAVGLGLFVFMFARVGRVMFLEDLFLEEKERRHGIGRHLFVLLAKVAKAVDCARLQWMALDWNTTALDFYRKLGAPMLSPALKCLRMKRDQIAVLATTCRGDGLPS